MDKDTVKILIVEDEIIIARELEARLIAMGYEVIGIVSSGQAAIDFVEEEEPNLILMDIVITGDMDGIEAATVISKKHTLPVIYLSAYTDKNTLERAKVTKPYGYIVKPFNERELHVNIEVALYKHRAEMKERQIQQWLSVSIESIYEAIIAVNNEGNIDYMNRVSELMLATEYQDAVGQPLGTILKIHEQGVETSINELVKLAIKEGMVTKLNKETRLTNHKNEETAVTYNISCIRTDSGKTDGAVFIIRDISEHKHTEELIINMESELRQAQKMDTIGQLAAGVAHDFNNELTIIEGCTETLLQEQKISMDQAELLNEIVSASKRAAALTKQLLIFSRKQIVNPVVVDINEIVTNSKKMLTRLLEDNIDLKLNLTDKKCAVKADINQIEQVIMNLVVNASDAVNKSGKIEIRTNIEDLSEDDVAQYIDVSAGKYFIIEVVDNGCGISQETKEKLFEPFFTTKEVGKGTGLGLATTYGIVKQAKGFIKVASAPGEGASFKVYLLSSDEEVEHSNIEVNKIISGAGTVLVVEDNASVLMLTKRVMEMSGYTVLTANNGKTGLKLFQENKQEIQLVITDVMMPGIGGIELAELIKKENPNIRILFLSGHSESDFVSNSKLKYGVDFLQKPYSIHALSHRVQRLLH